MSRIISEAILPSSEFFLLPVKLCGRKVWGLISVCPSGCRALNPVTLFFFLLLLLLYSISSFNTEGPRTLSLSSKRYTPCSLFSTLTSPSQKTSRHAHTQTFTSFCSPQIDFFSCTNLLSVPRLIVKVGHFFFFFVASAQHRLYKRMN